VLLEREQARREAAKAERERTRIEWSDLEVGVVLGEGSFGRVKLALHPTSGQAYALKCMRKGQLARFKQVQHVVNEKRILALCDHPFILKLAAVFHNRTQVMMLLEIVPGGELFSRLRRVGKLSPQATAIYAAMVVSAFGYLHSRRVAHRDLKPENLLFDAQGYLKLIDMGFAKVIEDRTYTLCGTPEYLAPEIISNRGHTLSCDWWCLGILIYEMLCGRPPFCADSHMDIYHAIMRGRYQTPPDCPRQARDLISQLLAQSHATRLGSGRGGHREVRSHNFFGGIDFEALEERALPVPWVPEITGNTDTSQFDSDSYSTDDDKTWDGHIDPKQEEVWRREFDGLECS